MSRQADGGAVKPLDVPVYGSNATFTSTVIELLPSYAHYSRHRVAFRSIAPFRELRFSDLAAFDAVALHYSIFPGFAWIVPPDLEQRISGFRGWKILYLQDENDHTETAQHWMERFGFRGRRAGAGEHVPDRGKRRR